MKVVSKKRRGAVGPEAKRSRSQSPSVPDDFKLPELKPDNPLGNQFVVPAYFCNLCSVFYQHESTTEEPHCSSQTHLHNLQKHYEELQQKSAGSSSKS
ncbi:matrin-3-like [Tautogolabrus adspersus]